MSNTQIGSGDKVLDWGVIIAALMLFAKTADVLSYFSPSILNDILGFNVSLIYGIICALLVEGLALALHFNHRAALSPSAQVVKWILLSISGACQVFDGFITTNSVAQMSDTMKAALSYGVPLIPLLIVIMVFGIGHLPGEGERKPFAGVRNLVRPALDKFWYGEGHSANTANTANTFANTPAPQSLHSDVPQPKLRKNKDVPQEKLDEPQAKLRVERKDRAK